MNTDKAFDHAVELLEGKKETVSKGIDFLKENNEFILAGAMLINYDKNIEGGIKAVGLIIGELLERFEGLQKQIDELKENK